MKKPITNNNEAIFEFSNELIEVKRMISSLAQFEDLKKDWLSDYQNTILSRSRIVFDNEIKTKSFDENDDEDDANADAYDNDGD